MADEKRTNMHDLLTAVELFVKIVNSSAMAQSWIESNKNHEYARIREILNNSLRAG
jgi:hypothetical protein